MKKNVLKFLFMAIFSVFAMSSFGQGTLTGKITDTEGEALPGVNIMEKGTTNGTITDVNGNFSLKVTKNSGTIIVSFIGFSKKEIGFDLSKSNSVKTIELENEDIGIAEVNILASVAVDRQTPVAVSSIKPELIEEKLGTQEFPEILKSTPSVYVTRTGGGYGDARINLRGFDSRNVAVMINGVPVNDMENGKVYWSNWAGLADATRSMQVQRGLGASKVAVPSVGGTINILTKTTDAKKGGNVSMGVGNDGYTKWGLTLSSGLTEKNWAFAFSLAHTEGNGYVDGTEFNAWSYYANISKKINAKHQIAFSVFGAPQWHGQRTTMLTIDKYQSINKGIKYNPDWGYKNGQVEYLRKNFYHKPQAILNHFWTISDKTNVITALYASIGTGGGTGGYGNTSKFTNYLTDDQIDFDRIVEENIAAGNNGSESILRASMNNHQWYGFISTLTHELSDNVTLTGGLDFRYYKGEHYREVTDLLGGKFYVDNRDVNNPVNIAKVGDKIAYYNDGIVGWEGTFVQAEYTKNQLSVFVAGAASNMSMKRVDYFNYTPDQNTSETLNFFGYSGKGGANYNLTEHHNVFINAGYFERQPDFRSAFLNYRNDPNPDAVNEKISSFELGYGYRGSKLSMNLNGYYTTWADKTFIKSIRQPDGSYYNANLLGVDALHMGVELDFVYQPVKNLTITGMLSVGNWSWLNNLEGVVVYDEDQVAVDTVNLYIKDVKVGGSAQTTAAFGLNYELFKGLKLGIDYNYYTNLFADFDPLTRGTQETGDNPNSWEMPSYQLFDVNLKYDFKINGLNSTFYAKVNNLFNEEYVSDALDGNDHSWQTATIYYGVGTTWSFGLKVRF